MSGDLERRYRRMLRLLPSWYREQWEEDMVATLLDGWLTGDPEADEYISKAARPTWAEVASVAGLGCPAVPGRRGRAAPVLRLGPGHSERGAHSDAGARDAGP